MIFNRILGAICRPLSYLDENVYKEVKSVFLGRERISLLTPLRDLYAAAKVELTGIAWR